MRKWRLYSALVLLAYVSWSCTTKFDVYAPEKEIRSVYCILNPADSVQYVRVAKAFQFQGDAIAYAGANDFTMTGLSIKLSGNGKVWTAVEVADFPKDSGGIFLPRHTVYKFITNGSGPGRDTLVPEKLYKLEVGTSDAPDYVTGETYIPNNPKILGELSYVAGAGTTLCLPRLSLDRPFRLLWRKLTAGTSYEVRVGLNFATNGSPSTAVWGPTDLFSDNQRCDEGSGAICYQFGAKELLRFFFRRMPPDQFTQYTYNTRDSCVTSPSLVGNLPKPLWFEVTAADLHLSNYIKVNNPKFTDLNGTKPEYTNMTGNIEAVGVFGSINIDRRYALFNRCGEGLLGLNEFPVPSGCNWD